MTGAGDVRGFYAALGIELPGWAGANATVRCFADPEAHTHEDRRPSCSVSTEHGAWLCWSCGARGGAYDAALAVGCSPPAAVELMVSHGLTEPRSPGDERFGESKLGVAVSSRQRPVAAPRQLLVSDGDVARWHEALFADIRRPWRGVLLRQRLWSEAAMRELELGFDGARITIPIRSRRGGLRGVLRYRAGGNPKMLAAPGTRLGLIPHPGSQPDGPITLMEGPADMIAARSHGCPAIAVPGDHAWQAGWAELLAGREVTIAMDCDPAGRAAALRIAQDLAGVASARILDLAPQRDDGFDVTDWLRLQHQPRRSECTRSSSSRPTLTR